MQFEIATLFQPKCQAAQNWETEIPFTHSNRIGLSLTAKNIGTEVYYRHFRVGIKKKKRLFHGLCASKNIFPHVLSLLKEHAVWEDSIQKHIFSDISKWYFKTRKNFCLFFFFCRIVIDLGSTCDSLVPFHSFHLLVVLKNNIF